MYVGFQARKKSKNYFWANFAPSGMWTLVLPDFLAIQSMNRKGRMTWNTTYVRPCWKYWSLIFIQSFLSHTYYTYRDTQLPLNIGKVGYFLELYPERWQSGYGFPYSAYNTANTSNFETAKAVRYRSTCSSKIQLATSFHSNKYLVLACCPWHDKIHWYLPVEKYRDGWAHTS